MSRRARQRQGDRALVSRCPLAALDLLAPVPHIPRGVEQETVRESPARSDGAGPLPFLARQWLPIAIAIGTLALAKSVIARVYLKLGHPGASLDDAYIHFQYARALAEGHPFRFQAGEPATSGATSLLWPALLAPFWLVGFRGEAILWPAWGVSFVALGALAYEARAITAKLAGEAAAIGVAAMVIAFPAFTWFAASGMEVVPFAWLLARCVRRASEWTEGAEARTRRRGIELAVLAWAVTLMRPEGALASLAIGIVLARFPREASWRSRAFALVALAPLVAQPLFLLAVTGAAKSTTAAVKLLPGNPYYLGEALRAAITANAKLLAGTLLNGEVYSAEFLPSGGAAAAFAGLVAIGVLGWRTKRPWRAALVIGLALAIFSPCTYVTFLWNRLRYLWPFATAWLVGLACLTRLAGDLLGALSARARVAAPIACGVVVGMLLMRMEWTITDAADSASGIDRQQVKLGRWAKDTLPPDARIGLNDTGAIAYFGDRKTFDIVGLTTRSEGRYWVAGTGSRLEHYERLHAASPAALPTHFFVYPEWFKLDMLLGDELEEATVTDSSIVGGVTMRAHVADYSLLGSGETPWSPVGEIVDALDVADLESEADHRYELLAARDGEEVAGFGAAPDGHSVIDGGRTMRTTERFSAHLRPGERARGVIRLEAAVPTRVRVRAEGRVIAFFEVEPAAWTEAILDVPAELAKRETAIELVTEGGVLTVFHYWFASSPSPPASAPSGTRP
jgi:hypothetical protein